MNLTLKLLVLRIKRAKVLIDILLLVITSKVVAGSPTKVPPTLIIIVKQGVAFAISSYLSVCSKSLHTGPL